MKVICSECKKEISFYLYEGIRSIMSKLEGFIGKRDAITLINFAQSKNEDCIFKKKCINCKIKKT